MAKKKKRLEGGAELDRMVLDTSQAIADAVDERYIVAVIVVGGERGYVFASNIEKSDSARMLRDVADNLSPRSSSVRTTNPRHN